MKMFCLQRSFNIFAIAYCIAFFFLIKKLKLIDYRLNHYPKQRTFILCKYHREYIHCETSIIMQGNAC